MALKKWQRAIHAVFDELKSHNTLLPDGLERRFIVDDHNGYYQILDLGWEDQKFVQDIMVHIDLRQDFIWVQADNTTHGVVEALLEQGVPKNRIVLGFHAPYKRPYTGFATGQEVPA
jgi:XisI protein